MEIEISARLYLQVGFNSGTANGLYFQMVDSQTDAIQHIVNGSNVGVPGEWLFSVGVLFSLTQLVLLDLVSWVNYKPLTLLYEIDVTDQSSQYSWTNGFLTD